MNKLIGKPWLYNSIPALIWFLLLVLPFLSGPGNIPAEMHRRFLVNTVFSNFLLLCIFYLHTYIIYPLFNKKGWVWYVLSIILVVVLYWSYWQWFAYQPGGEGDFMNHMPRYQGQHSMGFDRRPMGPPGGPHGISFVIGPFIALLCSYCYRVILDNAARQELLKERETIHLQTELNFLRSQISPHFMFNVLNNLVSLARKKSDDLEPAIINLSQLMRYMLYETDDNRVLLTKEIEYLKSYINLQLLRFGNEVKVHLNVSGDAEMYAIEPMLLIPFVENAFKHGTGLVENPVILISLSIDEATRLLQFKVVNAINAQDMSKDKSSGIGLSNVQRRLAILYPDKHRLKVINQNSSFSTELSIYLS